MTKIEVILAHEKHGDRIVRAEDGTVASAALTLLGERVTDGYWYDDEDQDEAKEILASEDGNKAWRFLYDRREHEYEWVETQVI